MPAKTLLLLAAALLALSACGSSGPAARVDRPHLASGRALARHVPHAVERLAFTDASGATVHLSDYADRTVVLMPAMTLCQETCPLDTAALARAIRIADGPMYGMGKDVEYLWVTVDPRRDVPAQLAAYRRLYAAPGTLPDWDLLTGDPATVARLWRYFGVGVRKVPQRRAVFNWRTHQRLTYDVEHGDEVFFIRNGVERYRLEGIPSLDGQPVPATMSMFMDGEGRNNARMTGGWDSQQLVDVLSWLDQRPMSMAPGTSMSGM